MYQPTPLREVAENFDGLPLGYMPAIILALVTIICLVAWFIAKRKIGDD